MRVDTLLLQFVGLAFEVDFLDVFETIVPHADLSFARNSTLGLLYAAIMRADELGSNSGRDFLTVREILFRNRLSYFKRPRNRPKLVAGIRLDYFILDDEFTIRQTLRLETLATLTFNGFLITCPGDNVTMNATLDFPVWVALSFRLNGSFSDDSEDGCTLVGFQFSDELFVCDRFHD